MFDEDGRRRAIIVPLLLSREQQYQFHHLIGKVLRVIKNDQVDEEELDGMRDGVPPGRILR